MDKAAIVSRNESFPVGYWDYWTFENLSDAHAYLDGDEAHQTAYTDTKIIDLNDGSPEAQFILNKEAEHIIDRSNKDETNK